MRRKRDTLGGLTPEDTRTLTSTSAPLAWPHVQVERRSHGAGWWDTPPLDTHLVCLYLGPPIALEQRRASRWRSDRITAGLSQIVPAGVPSDWKHREAADFIALHLSPSLVARIADDTGPRRGDRVELVDRFCLDDPQIALIARELDRELSTNGENGPLYAHSLGAALATLLLARHGARRPRGRRAHTTVSAIRLKRVLDHIEDHLTEPLPLTELASLAGVSLSHFAAVFRTRTGLAPHTYVIHRRVERARALLVDEGRSIADASIAAGFYDQSHLSRHMRRVLGLSPRAIAAIGRAPRRPRST